MGDVLACSGAVRRLAVEVGKVASDLRLLSMGPRAGIAEIQLPPVQPGSSIMPGKVNPSVPEMVNQVCYQVIGCDAAILAAADAGQLELNVMMPVIAWNALHAAAILTQAMRVLQTRCVEGIKADEARCRELLDRSTALATALSPYIGYAETADIAKTSVQTGRTIRELVRERGLLPEARLDAILSAEAMTSPGVPGQANDARTYRSAGVSSQPSALMLLVAAAMPAAQHTRLFRPEDLGELEGPDRDQWQSPDKIMDALGVGEGVVVADLGAGSGWFTIRLAGRVGPNGMVYAEDIQRQMIDSITRRVERLGLKNVKTVLGTASDPRLPAPVDAVLIVDSYHEMEQPVALLKNVARSLKRDGRIGIVNFTKDGGGPGPAIEDRVDPERVIADAHAAGLALQSRQSFLKYHYMLVFENRRNGTRRTGISHCGY